MRALRYCGLLQRRVAPRRPLRRTKRQRPPPLIRATLTSTRLTLPTASLPVLQSTSRERPSRWMRRFVAFRLRPLMLERGSFLPVVQSVVGGCPPPPGVLPPGVFPPGVLPPGVLPPGVLPAGAAGIASSTGGPRFFSSSIACTLSTAPAGSVTFFENVVPPSPGAPRSTAWPSTFATYDAALPQNPSSPGILNASVPSADR